MRCEYSYIRIFVSRGLNSVSISISSQFRIWHASCICFPMSGSIINNSSHYRLHLRCKIRANFGSLRLPRLRLRPDLNSDALGRGGSAKTGVLTPRRAEGWGKTLPHALGTFQDPTHALGTFQSPAKRGSPNQGTEEPRRAWLEGATCS